VVKYSSNTGLRVGVALAAVIIVVAAIVISKRRASHMGEEVPESTETGGATAPAVAAESGTAESGSAPQEVPSGHADGSVNGQVTSGSPAGSAPPGDRSDE